MKNFVFDVESAGLMGPGFAFGWVVITDAGEILEAGSASAGIDSVPCSPEDREWLEKNLPEHILRPDPATRRTLAELHELFRTLLELHADADVVVDCGYPVETSWLKACRAKVYPLHELATALKMTGVDPTGTFDRLPDEMPRHDPLCDARQTARIWLDVNRMIKRASRISDFADTALSNLTGTCAIGKNPDGFFLASDRQDDHGETRTHPTLDALVERFEKTRHGVRA